MTNRLIPIFEYLKNNFCTRILEIGVWKGDTAVKLIKASKNPNIFYYGIDLFEDITQELIVKEKSLPPALIDQAQQYINETSKLNILFQGNSNDILKELLKGKYEFDLIYIDGGHSKETLLNDIYYSKKLIKPGHPIFIDDYSDKKELSEVKNYIDELIKNGERIIILPDTDYYGDHKIQLALLINN